MEMKQNLYAQSNLAGHLKRCFPLKLWAFLPGILFLMSFGEPAEGGGFLTKIKAQLEQKIMVSISSAVPVAGADFGVNPPPNCEGFVSAGGRKYWLAVPINSLGGAPAIHVNVVGVAGTTGTISIKDNSFAAINFTIPANGFYEVDLPSSAVHVSGNQVTLDKGVLITADNDVNVYVISEKLYTTDGYLGIPVAGLGTEYYVITYNGLGATAESQATIVASKDNTNITVTRPNGQVHTATLSEGQVYVIQDPSTGDLSGTHVTSDRPVAVWGSVNCANVPTGTGTCDHIVEQMLPVSDWDVEYIVPPIPSDGQMLRVMAGEDGTEIFRNGVSVGTYNKGQFWTSAGIVMPTAVEHFTTNGKKIQVAQYATGNQINGPGNPGYDPAFGLVPSRAIWLKKHIFKSQPNFTNNLLMVTRTASTSNVTVNGAAISPAPTWTAIAGTDLSWTSTALAAGAVYTVENTDEIGLTVFGGKVDESYMLPGNMSLGDLDKDGIRNISDCDADGDGIYNSVEVANALPGTNGDSDGDGIVDELDLDSDNDGIPDNIEAQTTAGYIAPGPNVYSNGLNQAYDENTGLIPVDTDSDLIPDYLDSDSDMAGTSDLIESEVTLDNMDSDGDGLDDAVDTDDVNFGPVNAGITDVLNQYPNNGTEVHWRILGNMSPEISNGGGAPADTIVALENGTAVTDYNATDPDGETENGGGLVWSINGGADAALFAINVNTGTLTFINAPVAANPQDANGDNYYEVIIKVKDGSGEIDLQNLSVNVLPNAAPVITSPAAASMMENETIALDVEATDDFDAEGNGLAYSLTGNGADDALLDIDPNTGVLSFKNAPNFEMPEDSNQDNQYMVEVQVCDTGNACSTQAVAITVTDNENEPCVTVGAEIGTLDKLHLIPPFYARNGLDGNSVNTQYLWLSTPEATPFDVTIQNANGFNGNGGITQTVTISKSNPVRVTLSAAPYGSSGYGALGIVNDAGLNTANATDGLILTASKRFYATVRHSSTAQGLSLSAKGQTALGKRFRSGHLADNGQSASLRAHFISIMATEDNTTVNFNDISPTVTFVGGTNPTSVTLQKYESYVVGVKMDEYNNNLNPNDLNGTLLTSDKPIVVNTGSWLAGNGGTGQDIGADQILPTPYLGTQFIVNEGGGGSNAATLEVPIVVADSDNTEIYLKGASTPVATINAGEYYIISGNEYPASGSMFFRTSKPAYVYQSTSSNNNTGPGMNFVAAIIPGLETQELLLPDADELGSATISLVAPVGATVTVDGTVLTGGASVGGTADFVLYKVTGKTGHVDITATEPYFVSMVTVSGDRGSAGFFVGFPNSFAVRDATTTAPDTPTDIDVLSNDVKSVYDFTVDQICMQPSNGTATINPDGTIKYTPNAGFTGVDTFTYNINDPVSGINDMTYVYVSIDTDGDGVGDVVDADIDNDGILNVDETGDTDGDGVDDQYDLDSDNDGIFDVVEAGHGGTDADQDGRLDDFAGANGIVDAIETVAESGTLNYTILTSDSDALPDFKDLDSDNDGLPDWVEGQPTLTAVTLSGTVDANGVDTNLPNGITPVNTDGLADGPDYRDTDSDEDGVSDTDEAQLTLSGTVGNNGLDDALETQDDYTDPNGTLDDPTTLPDLDNDKLLSGDVDYRDDTQDLGVRLACVDYLADTITLKNFGTDTFDISGYFLCTGATTYTQINSLTASGSLQVPPGGTVTLSGFALPDTADLALYFNNQDFANANFIADFTQWGSGGNGRESVAAQRGIWTAGDFMSDLPVYKYIGDGAQNGLPYWDGDDDGDGFTEPNDPDDTDPCVPSNAAGPCCESAPPVITKE